MKIVAIIPARMGSSRFPGKPLALINGKPMIQHVYEGTSRAPILSETFVATCDEEIRSFVESIGGKAIMTGNHHERASDRSAEALQKLEAERGYTFDIVVMVQGDEPMTHPDMIEEAVAPFLVDDSLQVTNLIGKIQSEEEFHDRNVIKVACDLMGNALYFSRMAIPSNAAGDGVKAGKQVCIIPFRRNFLLTYLQLAPTPHEIAESVDMMRVLEHGHKVRMVPTQHVTYPVDTVEDLVRVERFMLLRNER